METASNRRTTRKSSTIKSALEEPRKKRSREYEDDVIEVPQPKKLKTDVKTKECIICTFDFGIAVFPEHIHANAEHDSDICSECWEIHLANEVATQAWHRVRCGQCKTTLPNETIKTFATTETYNSWLDKACKAAMEADEEWQTCPSASCGYGGYLAEDSIFICLLCKASYCVACNVSMHNGETCEVYQERLRTEKEQQSSKDEKASEQKVKRISKVCPNCNANVQKRSGCDHMTCRCGHQFCYRCRAPYQGENGIFTNTRNHARKCRHYPG